MDHMDMHQLCSFLILLGVGVLVTAQIFSHHAPAILESAELELMELIGLTI